MSLISHESNRCSSLPPSTFSNEDCLAVLDLSVEPGGTNGVPSSVLQYGLKQRRKLSNLETDEVANGTKYFNSCSVFRSYETSPAELNVAQSNRISPSGSSLVTDEDSGYGHHTFRQTGSLISIANSGLSGPDNNSTSGSLPRDELLTVMTEDLVDWFQRMYPQLTDDFDVDNFFDRISDGVLLCYYASDLHQLLASQCSTTLKFGRVQLNSTRVGGVQAHLPVGSPIYQTRGLQGSSAASGFVSRDNVSNFLTWCRQLGMPDSVLFESEDLVCRKNPRNVAICLLELARLGGRFGMALPELIQLEVEIDRELATEAHNNKSFNEQPSPGVSSSSSSITEHERIVYCRRTSCDAEHQSSGSKSREPLPGSTFCCSTTNDAAVVELHSNGFKTIRFNELRKLKNQQPITSRRHKSDSKEADEGGRRKPEVNRPVVDMRSLDEIVRDLLSQCTCPQTFPMIRVGEGRYLFGDKCTQIFVRILRSHVMVRVGGGWDTLNHFLTKYDDCRKANPPNYQVLVNDMPASAVKQATVNASNTEELLQSIRPSTTEPPSKEGSPIKGQGMLCAVKKSPSRELPNHKHSNSLDSKDHRNGGFVRSPKKPFFTDSSQNIIEQSTTTRHPVELDHTTTVKAGHNSLSQRNASQNAIVGATSGVISNSSFTTVSPMPEKVRVTQSIPSRTSSPSTIGRYEANIICAHKTSTTSVEQNVPQNVRKSTQANVFERLANTKPKKSSIGPSRVQNNRLLSRSTNSLLETIQVMECDSNKPVPSNRINRKFTRRQSEQAQPRSCRTNNSSKSLSRDTNSNFQALNSPLLVNTDKSNVNRAQAHVAVSKNKQQNIANETHAVGKTQTASISSIGLESFDPPNARFSRIPRPVRSRSLSRMPLNSSKLTVTTLRDV